MNDQHTTMPGDAPAFMALAFLLPELNTMEMLGVAARLAYAELRIRREDELEVAEKAAIEQGTPEAEAARQEAVARVMEVATWCFDAPTDTTLEQDRQDAFSRCLKHIDFAETSGSVELKSKRR